MLEAEERRCQGWTVDCKDPGPGMPSSSIGQGGQVAWALGKVSATSLQPGLHTAQALAIESQKAGQDSTLKSKQATWPTWTISMSTCALGELFLGRRFEGSRWTPGESLNWEPGNFTPDSPHGLSFCKPKCPVLTTTASGSCHQLPQVPPKADFPAHACSLLHGLLWDIFILWRADTIAQACWSGRHISRLLLERRHFVCSVVQSSPSRSTTVHGCDGCTSCQGGPTVQTRGLAKPEIFPHKKCNSEISHSSCDENPQNASA